MPEWSNGPHSKCGVRVTVPGVRIPLFPPQGAVIFTALFFVASREGFVQLVAPRQTCLRLSNVQYCLRNYGISFEKYLLKQVWQLFSTNLPNLRFFCTFSTLRSALGFCRRSNPVAKSEQCGVVVALEAQRVGFIGNIGYIGFAQTYNSYNSYNSYQTR